MSDRVLSMFGLCRKAGKISLGHDASIASIKKGHAKICLLCKDISERAACELQRACANLNGGRTELIRTSFTMDEIRTATGFKAGVLTIDDEGFAKKISQLLRNTTGEE
jgi:ribosomal protein L7Ae-like RNA K-turn-binding protein